MPITSPIVLTKIVSTGNETFSPLKTLSDGKLYAASGATLALPYSLGIRHSVQDIKNVGKVDQHLVQCIRTVLCADGVARSMVVNQTVRVPRDAAFTDAITGDTIGMTGGLWYITAERAALLLGYS